MRARLVCVCRVYRVSVCVLCMCALCALCIVVFDVERWWLLLLLSRSSIICDRVGRTASVYWISSGWDRAYRARVRGALCPLLPWWLRSGSFRQWHHLITRTSSWIGRLRSPPSSQSMARGPCLFWRSPLASFSLLLSPETLWFSNTPMNCIAEVWFDNRRHGVLHWAKARFDNRRQDHLLWRPYGC